MELARAFVDACNRRDADALVALAHDRIGFYPSTLGGSHRTYAGHDGLRQWVADLATGIPFEVRVSEIRPLSPEGFVVLSRVHFEEALVCDFAMIGFLREERIVDVRGYLSDEAMLTRLGLIP